MGLRIRDGIGVRRRWTAGSLGAGLGSPRGGLTLVELLAAMVVLLVGVYAVVALFPRLSRNITQEETRTSMARAVGRVTERAQTAEAEMPAATAPLDAHVYAVDPASLPRDPDSSNFSETPPNSRDDVVMVYGEAFTVPGAAVPGEFDPVPGLPTPRGYPCYVPKMGLVDPASLPGVTERRVLTMAPEDPGPGGSVNPGEFYLRPDGMLIANSGTVYVTVSYNWVDPVDGLIRHATDELVDLTAGMPVQGARATAQGGRGGRVLSESATASAVIFWSVSVDSPSRTTLPPDVPGATVCVVDPRAGQALYFPPSAAGKRLHVDYRLRRERRNAADVDVRRTQLMMEDRVVPSTAPYQLQLNFGFLDDAWPVLTHDFIGNDIADANLLLVDMSDGTPLGWGLSGGGSEIADVDIQNGIVTFDPVAMGFRLGHPVRVYYRTQAENCIQVYKTPSEFVEVAPGITPAVPNWYHRQYQVRLVPGAGANYALLHGFPTYLEDQTVQVDYLYRPAGNPPPAPVRVSSEMHVIAEIPGGGFGFYLNQPDVVGVLGVRGASVRVVGWWRADTGRVSRLDMSSMLFPGV